MRHAHLPRTLRWLDSALFSIVATAVFMPAMPASSYVSAASAAHALASGQHALAIFFAGIAILSLGLWLDVLRGLWADISQWLRQRVIIPTATIRST